MAAVITAVVGHRGTGKSKFLERAGAAFAAANRRATFVDVDHEIELDAGRPISELFKDVGEQAFRAMERAKAAEIFRRFADADHPVYVGLGAGYDGDIPAGVEVLWIQRSTDPQGRIFLDRPALDLELGPLEEYAGRYAARDDRYRSIATETLVVPEGVAAPTPADRLVLGLGGEDVGGYLTILPQDIEHWDRFLAKRLAWGVHRFEIRDDLLGESTFEAAAAIPPERRLVSHRTPAGWLDRLTGDGVLVDWALELGPPPGRTDIVSLHDRGDASVAEAAAALSAVGDSAHLKLAIEVRSFAEVAEGHRWWSADPANRSFLPRSGDGRWSWYRQIQRGRMPVNFLREGVGSAPDQPTLSEWVSFPPSSAAFAAIVGDPVAHSRTPAEHGGYFAERGMGVVGIRMAADECTADTLETLAGLGLTHAAVTSPLKEVVYSLCHQVFEPATSLGSVNTLLRSDDGWVGTNTDLGGLEAMVADLDDASVALWGGGGTRRTMLRALPDAVPYSARSGEPVAGSGAFDAEGPDIVIWAVGRDRQPGCRWPPAGWRPRRVVDLNYSEDSPGLEYAYRLGVDYRSGVEMFRVQAGLQREFWDGR